MDWSVFKNESIAWQGSGDFLRSLSDIVNSEAAWLRALTDTFYARNLVTGSEAESAQPHLAVRVIDDRALDTTTALLPWQSPDKHVTVSYPTH